MNCIILGDKFQKRMKSRGCVGLFKHNNKTIIQYQYQTIRELFPQAHIAYVCGFESKRFISFMEKKIIPYDSKIDIIHNKHYDKYNYGYSLSLARDYLNNDCLIMFGDQIINKNTFHRFNPVEGSKVFLSKNNKNPLGCIIGDNKIENIAYDLDNFLCNIYYLCNQHTNLLKDMLTNSKIYNYFIFEIINRMIDINNNISPLFISHKESRLQKIKGKK
jgi:CTP:phosphocholine cytidylyltransferase-like protein